MGFKRFSLLLSIRLVFLFASVMGLVLIIIEPGYHAATVLVAMVVTTQVFGIVRFVTRTNDDLTRFLDALRYGDFGQKFDHVGVGAGFSQLGDAFSDILEQFRAKRSSKEEELKHLRALVEHVPVPLLSVHRDGVITVHNNAARRLFGNVHVRSLGDLTQFGGEFRKAVGTLDAGDRQLVTFVVEETEQTLTLAATQLLIAGKSERLISLQDIQSELDVAQLKAWQDLVRVLTHEIMNSITPVASLAKTSIDLVDDAIKKAEGQDDLVEELGNVRDAVTTVSRRSDGLMNFVQSYRRLTRLPPPDRQSHKLNDVVGRVTQLVTSDWADKGITFERDFSTDTFEIYVDTDMVEQVLINLLQNAEQAVVDREGASVSMHARLSKRGRVVVDIADNGPGIPAELASKIFVPFYTTKREGSGVGLALTRQVMIAHGGSVTAAETEGGGATFTLTF